MFSSVRMPHLSFLDASLATQVRRVCGRSLALPSIAIASLLLISCFPQPSEALALTTRILVNKKVTIAGSPPAILFQPLLGDVSARNGFSELADYPSQSLYEGSEANAAQFRHDVASEGFEVDTATDLNHVSFHDHLIDPDTGAANPPFPTSDAMPVATGADALYLWS
jgi:hypothetical protein